MDTFDKTQCGYTQQYKPDYAGRTEQTYPFRSIAEVSYDVNCAIHADGGCFSPWTFIRSDGVQCNEDYVNLHAASGYLIFQTRDLFTCVECKFDPEFGFYYRLRYSQFWVRK